MGKYVGSTGGALPALDMVRMTNGDDLLFSIFFPFVSPFPSYDRYVCLYISVHEIHLSRAYLLFELIRAKCVRKIGR